MDDSNCGQNCGQNGYLSGLESGTLRHNKTDSRTVIRIPTIRLSLNRDDRCRTYGGERRTGRSTHSGVFDSALAFLQEPFTTGTLLGRIRDVIDAKTSPAV